METLGILGPPGTHSEAAAIYLNEHGGKQRKLKEYAEIYEVLRAVERGEVDAALVPVENSLEGSVNITLDVLAQSDRLIVTQELIWPVRNLLMGKSSTAKIKRILSHPQPISQCREYLWRHYPDAETVKVASTARAAEMVEEAPEDSGWAAICTERGGRLHSLQVIAEGIQDNPHNCTRFFEVKRRERTNPIKNPQKVLIICQIDGAKAGSLYDVLGEFARRQVNMTRIESRPARTELGAYIFFLELETDIGEEIVAEAVEAVKNKSIWLKHLGAFSVLRAS
ncbi:MAG: prephenate dehydratase [Selenomonadaceae bacterium]|nr:prephenate dehydratase [Selenomonadaceae bacterium]